MKTAIKKLEKTFAIIKPDAIKQKNTGKIIDIIENNNFEILRIKKIKLSKKKAELFYDMHKDKPFFKELVTSMSSGPIVIMVLAKENAVIEWRNLMGATDPLQAAPGTIRKLYGTDIGKNTVHGSDSLETSKREIGLFFPTLVK